ncbi:MAG: hypothetical protein ACJA2Z_000367, partial [Candidatus Paceibacteria bacterium]
MTNNKKHSRLAAALTSIGLIILIAVLSFYYNKESNTPKNVDIVVAPISQSVLTEYALNTDTYLYFNVPLGTRPTIDRIDGKTLMVVINNINQGRKFKRGKDFPFSETFSRIGYKLPGNFDGNNP